VRLSRRYSLYPCLLPLAIGAAAIFLTREASSAASGDGAPKAQVSSAIAEEAPFLTENGAAMTKMMADMTIKPSGDVDRDFVAMMVPHHQGAIEMAQAVLRHGHNEQLRRIAQEIIITQLQEIAAMRLAVGEPLPPSAAAPTQPFSTPTAAPSSMPQHSMTVSPDAK
jgi:hypothetical protein